MPQDYFVIFGSFALALGLIVWISQHRRRRLRAKRLSNRIAYVVPFRLYSADGTRGVEVRVRSNGQAYFVEQERVDDTFKNRGSGEEIGPFATAEAAEAAAVDRPWFSGE
jgi:hypothetical protein